MTSEYAVAMVEEVPRGSHIVVEIGGREIGIFNVHGRYHALPNVCVHQNGPLCRGAVSGSLFCSGETDWKWVWAMEGEIIVCPWHGLEYEITTGQCLAYPKRRLRTYEVNVEQGQIVVKV